MTKHKHRFVGSRGVKACVCGKTADDECSMGHPRTLEFAYKDSTGRWCCRVCHKERVREWRATKRTAEQHERIKANARRFQRERQQQRRELVINHYGGTCACCSEDHLVFLCLDHIGGGGNQHRKEIGATGSVTTYRWVIKQGFPPGFRVLCHNCSHAIHVLGECPHQTEGGGAQ